jgi:hypothetical protein
MTYLRTAFHMPNSNGLLLITDRKLNSCDRNSDVFINVMALQLVGWARLLCQVLDTIRSR